MQHRRRVRRLHRSAHSRSGRARCADRKRRDLHISCGSPHRPHKLRRMVRIRSETRARGRGRTVAWRSCSAGTRVLTPEPMISYITAASIATAPLAHATCRAPLRHRTSIQGIHRHHTPCIVKRPRTAPSCPRPGDRTWCRLISMHAR